MEIFKQLKKLGYKHYIDLTIEELDALPIDNVEKTIEYSLIIDWFRNKYNLLIDSPKLDVWNIGKWSVKITSLDNSIVLEKYVGQPYWRIYRCFRIYEEARESAILKCIELLN